MSRIAKSKAGRKQATTGGRVTKTPWTKKDTVRQRIITFLHGHEFIDGVEVLGVFWLGWSYQAWEPVWSLN
ncbi:hypothetical protein IFR04_011434 [Cadophora malorum]|uniref:Uncharacterized protein n=1 Tax=Cadophora malorum TaxID=108018 RepID=A0A8H7T621_9HELO|nr:hypothetical protein IFR04_011434 [Cadophora malorum]